MDYNTLKEIVFNMPETYEDLKKVDPQLCNVIRMDVILDKLVEKGIFKDWNEVLIDCSKMYQKYRKEASEVLNQLEKGDEYKNI